MLHHAIKANYKSNELLVKILFLVQNLNIMYHLGFFLLNGLISLFLQILLNKMVIFFKPRKAIIH